MTAAVHFDQVVRALPIARPPEPVQHEPWPEHALLLRERTARPSGGALTYAAATLLGGRLEPSWAVSGRAILASDAHRFFARGFGLPVLQLEEFLEEAVYPCVYKPPLRAGIVAWSVPSLASSAAWTVDARGGAFRFTWWTYVDKHGDRRPDLYRMRVRVTPSSGGRAAVGFDGRKSPDPEDWVEHPDGTRTQYRGRFLSLASLGYKLSGEDGLTFPQALALWGIERPKGDGSHLLLAELEALTSLYQAMLTDLARWGH